MNSSKSTMIVFALLVGGCASTTAPNLATTESASRDVQRVDVDRSTLSTRIGILLAQGDIAARDGRIDEAFHLYLVAERLDPTDDQALVRAGNLHRTMGNSEVAEKAWRVALERKPENGAVYESLGFLMLEGGRYGEAYDAFEAALKWSSSSHRAAIGMGLACEKRNDFPRALEIYESALVVEPASVELRTYRARALMSLGRFFEAKEVIAAIVDEPLPVTWIVRGDLFAIDGEYAGALGAYLKTLSEPWAYQRLGEHALRRKDYERAMRYFRRAAESSPAFFEDADHGIAIAREHLGSQAESR